MTGTTPDPTSLAAILEPTAVDRNYAYGTGELIQASQAVSLQRIATALETIVQHLAPVKAGTSTGFPYPPEMDLTIIPAADATDVRVIGARVRDKASGDHAHVVGIDGPDRINIRWVEHNGAFGNWPAAEFERVTE